MIDNKIYPNLNKLLRTSSMVSILPPRPVENDQITVIEDYIELDGYTNYNDTIIPQSEKIECFRLSNETLNLFNLYIEKDEFFKRKLSYISMIKDIINSPEILTKYRETLKIMHIKNTNDLRFLISKLSNEISLFTNKILLLNTYDYNNADSITISEIKQFINLSNVKLQKTYKPYENL
jgi:hypothetical protein